MRPYQPLLALPAGNSLNNSLGLGQTTFELVTLYLIRLPLGSHRLYTNLCVDYSLPYLHVPVPGVLGCCLSLRVRPCLHTCSWLGTLHPRAWAALSGCLEADWSSSAWYRLSLLTLPLALSIFVLDVHLETEPGC